MVADSLTVFPRDTIPLKFTLPCHASFSGLTALTLPMSSFLPDTVYAPSFMLTTPSSVVLSLYWTVLLPVVVRLATLSAATLTSPTSSLLNVISPPTIRTIEPSRREPLLNTIVSAVTAHTHDAAKTAPATFFMTIFFVTPLGVKLEDIIPHWPMACQSYLCTRPEALPAASAFTSATLIMLKSCSMECFRHDAATA